MKIKTVFLGSTISNCYIITDDETGDVAVVDPGSYTEKLAAGIEPIADKIKFILLTHMHFDHIMGVHKLKEVTGAKVVIHRLDAAGLIDSKLNLFDLYGHEYDYEAQAPVTADILLEDGDIIELGSLNIHTMHTPGHTDGGVCYIVEDVIFSGDTLFCNSIGRTDFYGGNHEEIEKSLEKLKDMQGDYRVFPGHGFKTTLSRERETNPYLGSKK